MNIGIDFGTTNSVISYFLDNDIKILKINNKSLIPSKIKITKNKIYYGYEVNNDLDGLIINNFKNNIFINKIIKFNDKEYELDILIKNYLIYLTKLIKNNFKNNNFNCIISVPNNFDDSKKLYIRDIFLKENFNIERIINESSAAAIYSSYNNKNITEKILIVDIGGGTTDLTVLEKDEELFEIVESIGDSTLGGNNFTDILFDDLKKKYNLIWNDAEILKKSLLNNDKININLKNNIYYLSQNYFENIFTDLIEKLKNLYSKIQSNDINKIILVGGSSKLLLIKRVTELFFKKNTITHNDLHTIVAKGSCKYLTNLLNKNSEIIVLDIVKLSIGIETSDDNFSIIIPKGTNLPAKISKRYVVTDLDESEIKIYQGNSIIAKNNTLIKNLKFNNYQIKLNDVIEITINVDINELINIQIINLKNSEKINTTIEKTKIIEYKKLDKTKENEVFLKNKLIYEIKNIIKKYLDLIENNNKIENKNIIKNNLNNILKNIDLKSNNDLKILKNKLFKKLGYQKI